MREIYEKYYTVRLYARPDLHFPASIIDIPGEYDTEEEAKAAAEPEYRKTCDYNKETGESYSWFEIQIIEHYKKIECETGKWKKILIATVPITIYGYECPFCEFRTPMNNFHFCPNCGVRLEGEECSE